MGTFPGLILYCFLGASSDNVEALEHAGKGTTVSIIVVVMGLLAGSVVVWFMTNYAKKELEALEVQYALLEDGAEDNSRSTAAVEVDTFDARESGKNNIEIVGQKIQDEGTPPTMV